MRQTPIPQPPPGVSPKQMVAENQAKTDRNMALLNGNNQKGGTRRRPPRFRGGEQLSRTGNPQSDANALASANLIKKMDQILVAQQSGGRRRKRRNKTRKNLSVNYVLRRRR